MFGIFGIIAWYGLVGAAVATWTPAALTAGIALAALESANQGRGRGR